jgi:hypothetical protein
VAASIRGSSTWGVSAGSSSALKAVDPRGEAQLVHSARGVQQPRWGPGTASARSRPLGSSTTSVRPT